MITIAKDLVDITIFSSNYCSKPISVELKYATTDNFLGRVVAGYNPNSKNIGLVTKVSASQLCEVQEYIVLNFGCSLLVYDAYRPLQAIEDFTKWLQECNEDDKISVCCKTNYYPHLDKAQLIKLGHVEIDTSLHQHRNAISVVLIDVDTNEILDMGSTFDFFDPISSPSANINIIGADAYRYRYILTSAMERFGFTPSKNLYWRFYLLP